MLAYIPYMDPLGMESGFCSPLLAGILLVRASIILWMGQRNPASPKGWSNWLNPYKSWDKPSFNW